MLIFPFTTEGLRLRHLEGPEGGSAGTFGLEVAAEQRLAPEHDRDVIPSN